MTNYVLVHGAWHGGWCYARVADRLRAKGHRVFTPTLAGLGERSHEFGGHINLSTHIADVVNVITWERLDNVVLLGHSYGGMVITGAADAVADKISTLVYLDAMIPSDGQSVFDMVPPEILKAQIDGAAAHGGFGIPPTSAAAFEVNEKDREWVDTLCTPHPIGCQSERIKLTGAHLRVRNKVFVLAANWGNGRGFRRYRDMAKAQPGWTVLEMPCGHDAMIDMPDELTEILLKSAN
ncbi:MAG TPA: alpha/beta hydrolase [Stellaceae bacterium]|nr:alpha/beta hydrolase [Stellaceae bacterium]